jgi:hypothetical protein
MPISADCPRCGKTYQVKDDFAGKKFRCKACQGVVTVPAAGEGGGGEKDPWDDLDLGSFQSGDPYADAESEAPAEAPRRRTKGKKKSKSQSGGMPATIMTAIGCEAVLILFYLFNTIRGVVGGELQEGAQIVGGVCGVIFVAMINGGAAFGYFNRQNVIRWISVVLTSITCLTCFGCGIFALVGPAAFAQNLPAQAQAEMGSLVVDGILMIVTSIVRVVLLVCLLLPASSQWFEK